MFEFVFHTLSIQPLLRRQSESMVNHMRINSAQSIFLGISPVVKQYLPLPSSIACKGMVSCLAGDIDFNQMSLSQSESTILHESKILLITYSQMKNKSKKVRTHCLEVQV